MAVLSVPSECGCDTYSDKGVESSDYSVYGLMGCGTGCDWCVDCDVVASGDSGCDTVDVSDADAVASSGKV